MQLQSIVFDNNNFRLGVSTTDKDANAGISPDERGHNLFKDNASIFYPQPAGTDLSTNLEDEIICMVQDPTNFGVDALILDEAGKFYTLDGTTLTKRQTDAGRTYSLGTSDMVTFKGDLYATSQTDICKISTLPTLATMDATWWTGTEGETALNSSYRHPMVVVEDTLIIANKNALNTWDGTTSTSGAMSLPTGLNITAMVKALDGIHLIAFTSENVNYSHTVKSKSTAFIIDTNTFEFVREIPLSDQVESAWSIAGVTYVTFGARLGVFNGNGIDLLRDLSAPASGAIYKHRTADFDGIALAVDNNSIYAFGDIDGRGAVGFYPFYNNDTGNEEITAILPLSQNQLLAAYATDVGGTPKLIKLDYDNADGLTDLKTNPYSFGGKVWVRRIEVELESPMSSGSAQKFMSVAKDGTETEIGRMYYSDLGAVDSKRMDCNILTDIFQLKIDWQATPAGVRRITIYYESGE